MIMGNLQFVPGSYLRGTPGRVPCTHNAAIKKIEMQKFTNLNNIEKPRNIIILRMCHSIRLELVIERSTLERVKRPIREIQQVLHANDILRRFIHQVIRHLILYDYGVGHLGEIINDRIFRRDLSSLD